MKTRKLISSYLACCAIFIMTDASASEDPVVSAAKHADWQAGRSGQLEAILKDKEAVNALVHDLYGNSVVQPTVGEYAFADLKGDGTLELITTLDFSGRGFYNTVYVISNVNGSLVSHTIRAPGVSVVHLEARVVDLKGDGTKELLVPRALAQYQGARAIPTINDVYKWNGAGFVQSDASFKEYYQNKVLPNVRSALDAVQHGHSSAGSDVNQMLSENYQKEIAAIDEILNN